MQEKEKYQMIQDKISGCVFAGALGDALGYVVEFDLYSSIKNKYGKDGIQDLLRTGEEAIISDDTQMTLLPWRECLWRQKMKWRKKFTFLI